MNLQVQPPLPQAIMNALGPGWHVVTNQDSGTLQVRVRLQHPEHGIWEVPLNAIEMARWDQADLVDYVLRCIGARFEVTTTTNTAPWTPRPNSLNPYHDPYRDRERELEERRAREAEDEARQIVLDAIRRRSEAS